jgi:hypothetical protein
MLAAVLAERKRKEEERMRQEEERIAQERARRAQEEKQREARAKEAKEKGKELESSSDAAATLVVPTVTITHQRSLSVIYDESPLVSMYKTPAGEEQTTSGPAEGDWHQKKDALSVRYARALLGRSSPQFLLTPIISKPVDPAAASLRRRLTTKRDATIKRHRPMLRKGSGDEECVAFRSEAPSLAFSF